MQREKWKEFNNYDGNTRLGLEIFKLRFDLD